MVGIPEKSSNEVNASQADDPTGGVTQEDNSIGPGSKKKKVVRRIVHRRSTAAANNIVQGNNLSATSTSMV